MSLTIKYLCLKITLFVLGHHNGYDKKLGTSMIFLSLDNEAFHDLVAGDNDLSLPEMTEPISSTTKIPTIDVRTTLAPPSAIATKTFRQILRLHKYNQYLKESLAINRPQCFW